MALAANNYTDTSVIANNYTDTSINATGYGDGFSYLLLSEATILLNSTAYDLRGLLDGTNLTNANSWT